MEHVAKSITELLDTVKSHPIKTVQAAAEIFGISEPVLVSKDRHQHIAHARIACCYVLRKQGYSFPEIGRIVFRDHTTVMSNVSRAMKLIMIDDSFAHKVESIHQILRPKYLKIRIEE